MQITSLIPESRVLKGSVSLLRTSQCGSLKLSQIFFMSLPQVEETSRVHFSKAIDHTNNMPTAYINGDRFLFAKLTTDEGCTNF